MAKSIQLAARGLFTDLNEEFQPENTYRFLLNGIFESLSGERGGVISERGNRPIIGLPTNITNSSIIGDCLLPNQNKVLFIAGKDLNGTNIQIIALHKKNNTYLELLRTECLEFEPCDQIDCIFKVHNGCDIIIYFTDHRTKYKSVNITNLESQDGRYELNDPLNPHTPVGPVPLEDNAANYPNLAGEYGWNCDLFLLSLISNHPSLYFNGQSNNGNLRTGTYTFFIRLLDNDLNPTDWLAWTNPITVKQGDFLFNSPPDQTDGVYVPSANFEKNIPRSISLLIDDLDPSLEYYEIGVVERTINTNTINRSYRTGVRLIPDKGSDIFLFNDVDDIRFVDVDLATFLVKTRKIDVVQAHTQINNRLVLGNVTGTVRDWDEFQRLSNDIRVEYFTYNTVEIEDDCGPRTHFVTSGDNALQYEITNNGLTSDAIGVNYSAPNFLSYGMSLMRDEVYALGIIYVFSDGSESPVFHIPGRPKFDITSSVDGTIVDTWDIDGYDYAQYATQEILSFSADPASDGRLGLDQLTGAAKQIFNGPFDGQVLVEEDHNRHGNWESDRLTNLLQDNDNVNGNIENDEYKYLYGFRDHVTCAYRVPFANSACESAIQLERWQYYNTAIRRKETALWTADDEEPTLQGSNPTYTFSGGFRGVPGYFDTGIEYPDLFDCNGNRIFPEGPVRHHRMPDHRIEQLFDQQGDLGVTDITTFPSDLASDRAAWAAQSNILGVPPLLTAPPEAEDWQMNDSEGSLKLYPLGIYLSNVVPPDKYRDEVVGYYVVRSDRSGNKTVIDKGFMNVCDTSVSTKAETFGNTAVDDFAVLDDNKIYTADFSLIPVTQPGSWDVAREGKKNPVRTWWNILEIHTPKSTFNEPVILTVDFIKLESTVFGDMFFDSDLNQDPSITVPRDSYFERYDNQNAWCAVGVCAPWELFDQGGWNGGFSTFLNRHKYPRMQNAQQEDIWSFVYNIPISGLVYTGYNEVVSTSELGQGFTEIENGRYQQRTMIGRYNQNCTSVVSTGALDDDAILTDTPYSMPTLNMPYNYWMLKRDIARDENGSFFIPTARVKNADSFINAELRGTLPKTYTSPGDAWAHQDTVTNQFKWSVSYSPYMYYIALKSAVTPYQEFDGINYVKMHSYMIPFDKDADVDPQLIPVTGGDTFINRFQFEKGFWLINYPETNGGGNGRNAWRTQGPKFPVDPLTDPGPPAEYADNGLLPDAEDGSIGSPQDNQAPKFASTLTVGYVESEINSPFRHLQEGDFYRSFPFNTRNSYYNYLYQANRGPGGSSRGELDDYMEKQEISYRYKEDYSSVNNEIQSFALGSTFDYCSECSESFPNTLFYSEISFDSQTEDFYKIFLISSARNIPNNTGAITNMFVKNSDLYVHTENNLWKMSVAAQELQTSTATISVGQGGFLDREPIKLFNNDDAVSRGGCIDKFSSLYVDGQFIWLDRNSGTVFSLGDEMKVISDAGLSRYFSNNSESLINLQFLALADRPYPLICTSCESSAGYKAVFDAEHGRYILTKKDHEILPDILSGILELTVDPNDINVFLPDVVAGNYYYDNDGVYFANVSGNQVADKFILLEYLNLTDNSIAKNHSWTLSFSIKDNAWSSFHSYIPNWTYYDSSTYYSYIVNGDPVDTNVHPVLPDAPEGQTIGANMNQFSWEHNYGPFQNYYSIKNDFIIDYVYKKQPYTDKTFDTIEYTSNIWLEEKIDNQWIEIPFVTFDRFYVYNNTQLSNQKTISVSNLDPYKTIQYDVNEATAHQWRNLWRINRLRDMTVGRLGLTDPKFTTDWNESTYQNEFFNGYGYIDKVINPDIIDINKDVYQLERFTEKFLNVRLFFKPLEDYKITFKILTGEKRDRL